MTNKSGGKMYIQDKVEEYADEVFQRMDKGAHMYFCGLKVRSLYHPWQADQRHAQRTIALTHTMLPWHLLSTYSIRFIIYLHLILFIPIVFCFFLTLIPIDLNDYSHLIFIFPSYLVLFFLFIRVWCLASWKCSKVCAQRRASTGLRNSSTGKRRDNGTSKSTKRRVVC